MPHLNAPRQDAPARILEIRGGTAERSAVVARLHGDGNEEILAEADLRLAPIHPVHFIASRPSDSFTVVATPLTLPSQGIARVAVVDHGGAQLGLITKDHTRSFLRTTFDIAVPHTTFKVVEANLLLGAMHRFSMVLTSPYFWLLPPRTKFEIRHDGARVGRTRTFRNVFRCDMPSDLDWRVAAVIPLAIETMLNGIDHQRWSMDRRYLAAVRDHQGSALTSR